MFDTFMALCLAVIVAAIAAVATAFAYGIWVQMLTKGLQ